MSPHDINTKLDQAVVQRLARLRSVPVDVSRLDASLQGRIPPHPAPSAPRVTPLWIGRAVGRLGPVRAAAASLLVMATLAAVLLVSSTGPVVAAPAEMADVHQRLISGESPITRVDSVEEARQVLRSQWSDAPTLPEIPAEHVAACCLRSVQNRRVACLLLDGHGGPVSVVVGRAKDFRLPEGPTRTINGITYRVGASGGMHLVMTEHAGRMICVIGEVEVERLVDLASELRF